MRGGRMSYEKRLIYFDTKLEIEAYWFLGIMQKFPNHFHEYYVIGYVENGQRRLECKNKDYVINPGSLVVLNPFDSHTCSQINNEALDWRCINIKKEIMGKAVKKLYGKDNLPVFSETVIFNEEILVLLKKLHALIISGSENNKEKQQKFYDIIDNLSKNYAIQSEKPEIHEEDEISRLCDYMKSNYIKKISLTELSDIAGLNKFTLLRNFNKIHGVTPYQYLETIRIEKAKQYLEAGSSPAEVALNTGFSDQSHFTRFFKSFIGLTPKQYQKIFKEKDLAGEYK
jgi:AraC-like DNA-binding protein